MRDETRPEGSEAVDRVTVSGTAVERAGEENQRWNCVKGERERSERWSVPIWNWAACCGCVDDGVGLAPGATEMGEMLAAGRCGREVVGVV